MKRLPPLSEMERIEQILLVEKLDEILKRIDNEDIGFVITENGLPEMGQMRFSLRRKEVVQAEVDKLEKENRIRTI